MSVYLLFGGSDYYPAGGWGDFIDSFETIEEAKATINAKYRHEFVQMSGYRQKSWWGFCEWDWAQIVCDQEVVAEFRTSNDPNSGDGWCEP